MLLAAWAHWGERALPRLNGMFAFSIFDRRTGSLACARDRLGEKPFVYSWDGRRLGFASEHKALVAAGLATRKPSWEAVYEYLARGYLSPGRSFFADIVPLCPGHALRVEADGSLRCWEWWQPDLSPMEAPEVDELAGTVGSLLDDAVRLRLRSDVPVGAHLSGGLDSSAVVAAAARHSPRPLHVFTGAFSGDRGSDERRYARVVVAHLGLLSSEIEIGLDELAPVLDRLLWHLDEPVAGPGAFPQLRVADRTAQEGIKVVLGGQGGDELFGGYLRHRLRGCLDRIEHGRPGERAHGVLDLARLALPAISRVRRTMAAVPDGDLAPWFVAAVDPAFREETRRPRLRAVDAGELMSWDLRNYLPALLQVEDRTSMAASIESRTPLLDHRLVELMLRVPAGLRVAPGPSKPILRAAVRGWLPEAIVGRRDKAGFPTPLEHWKKTLALRRRVADLLSPDSISPSVFRDELLARGAGLPPARLWSVVSVQAWLRGPDAETHSGRPGRT